MLVDIGHPAHVHLFKNIISYFQGNGVKIVVTTRENDASNTLLKKCDFKFIVLGKKSDSIFGKLFKQVTIDRNLLKIVREHNIQIALGSSISIAHMTKLAKLVSIVLDDDDDEVEPYVKYVTHPFCSHLLSPEALKGKRRRKDTIFYAGYHELAYLHPKRFRPDPEVLREIGLSLDDVFFVLRFNSFKAHHDIGARGISAGVKEELVKLLTTYGRVLITCEGEMNPKFSEYRIGLSPDKIHSLLYYARMFVGDSQTMTSEAAVLGTPSVRCNSFVGRISYLEEEEHRYGLTYGFTPDRGDEMLRKVKSLLEMPDLKHEWQRRRQNMLAEKIDVTAFMVWLIENYPESFKIMKENPDYQYRFK
jgi:predicted glycosyltransferase